MKRVKQNLLSWMTEKMQLPADVMLDLPRITMIGQLHIYIENYHQVIHFSRNELHLSLKKGKLIVAGDHFIIKTIQKEELLLEGEIEQVKYVNDGEGD